MAGDQRRARELAKIHLLRKQAGLDEDTYRDLLERLTKHRSASQLDTDQRGRVLDELARLTGGKPSHKGTPHTLEDRPELTKIEALLAEAKRPWAYADGMARHMYRVERVAWCTPEQLRGVLVALVKDAEKHGRRTE